MPFGDGTGPRGNGPMTGRGAGFCAGYPVPGYMNPGAGRGGFGFGRGGGRGWRHWYHATGMPGWMRANQGMPAFGGRMNQNVQPNVPESEATILKNQAEFLKQQLDEIQNRINDLASDK